MSLYLLSSMIVPWGLGFRPQLSGDNINRRQWIFVSFTREDLGPSKGCPRGDLDIGERKLLLSRGLCNIEFEL